MAQFTIKGQLVDVFQNRIYPAEVSVNKGRISGIALVTPGADFPAHYILPGFIDSHVHVESSMLVPSEFGRLAVVHGTVGSVSDPHEIANVCGIDGVEYMIENGKTIPFKFNFGAPSCVPATSFETAGATLTPTDVENLLRRDEIRYLSEMMNFPGVLNDEEEVMKKIAAAHRLLKPVDGHAPGLRGEQAREYISSGISTDHECINREEAQDKLSYGMKIIIREGSAAKNFEALIGLLHDYPNQMMFCSDDKHPDSLVDGHINQLCARAVAKGIDVMKVIRAACINPVLHYKLDIGLLRTGDPADLIVVKDLERFEVVQTYINGELVAENGRSLIKTKPAGIINNFSVQKKNAEEFAFHAKSDHPFHTIEAIEALDGQLITNKFIASVPMMNGKLEADVQNDILKMVVVNRYNEAPIAKAFIRNIGLQKGAIASSVAHDSHNIVAVGVDDESICRAVNDIIENKGGVSVAWNDGRTWKTSVLPLPVVGLMSTEDGYKVAEQYTAIDTLAKSLGSKLSAPFMTLSFMALLVIPHLKLSDKGLFDGDSFQLLAPTF